MDEYSSLRPQGTGDMTTATIHVRGKAPSAPNSLFYEISTSPEIAHFFQEDIFWVTYPLPISCVPEGIRIIPLLSLICPIAWAVGADIIVPELDQAFHGALPAIRDGFQKMYPELPWSGSVMPATVKPNASPAGRLKTATLFSGGLDSVVTYLRNMDQQPLMFSVWGADVAINQSEAWSNVSQAIDEFRQLTGAESFAIKSNFRTFINESALNIYSGNKVNGGWWGGVEHGLILTGVCAPITYSLGVGRLYIPSSYSSTSPWIAWGSTPEIDNLIRWAELSVEHESYELDRQGKTAFFADRVRNDGRNYKLRVCWKSAQGNNCSACEKCCRTIIGLLLEGLQPENHGFSFGPDTLPRIKRKLEAGKWSKFPIWGAYIKRRIPERMDLVDVEYKWFFQWFLDLDIEKPIIVRKRRQYLRRILKGILPENMVTSCKMAQLRIRQRFKI